MNDLARHMDPHTDRRELRRALAGSLAEMRALFRDQPGLVDIEAGLSIIAAAGGLGTLPELSALGSFDAGEALALASSNIFRARRVLDDVVGRDRRSAIRSGAALAVDGLVLIACERDEHLDRVRTAAAGRESES